MTANFIMSVLSVVLTWNVPFTVSEHTSSYLYLDLGAQLGLQVWETDEGNINAVLEDKRFYTEVTYCVGKNAEYALKGLIRQLNRMNANPIYMLQAFDAVLDGDGHGEAHVKGWTNNSAVIDGFTSTYVFECHEGVNTVTNLDIKHGPEHPGVSKDIRIAFRNSTYGAWRNEE